MKTLRIILIATILSISLYSCQKQFNPDLKNLDTQLSFDQIIHQTFISALQTTDNDLGYYNFKYDNCTNVSTIYDKNSKRYITTIDFSGTCPDNIQRDGEIIFYWKKGWKIGLNSNYLTAKFNNFSFDNIIVNGSITISFSGFNQRQNPMYKIRTNKITLTFNDNTKATVALNEQIVYTSGFYTINSSDDVINVNYKAKGTTRDNKKFFAVAHDLVFNFSMNHLIPTSGTKVLQTGSDELIFNFGDGQPDTKFTVTKDDQAEEFQWAK